MKSAEANNPYTATQIVDAIGMTLVELEVYPTSQYGPVIHALRKFGENLEFRNSLEPKFKTWLAEHADDVTSSESSSAASDGGDSPRDTGDV